MAVTVNLLITGPPRSGKTTVIQRVQERLESRGYEAGGVYCPELRSNSDRVGFEIVDVMTGDAQVLAHVDREEGPHVGKYRVNVPGVDAICQSAFPRALGHADFLIVDEIAPMEIYSDEFVEQVRRALDADLPLVAAIHYRSTEGFIASAGAILSDWHSWRTLLIGVTILSLVLTGLDWTVAYAGIVVNVGILAVPVISPQL